MTGSGRRPPRVDRERLTPEHCFILQLWGLPEDNSCSVARARVRPGVTTAWHALRGIREWYLVAEGRGRIEVGDRRPALVRRGELVPIPAGVRQRITNTGRGDLIFYCLCRPAFRQRAYVNLERPGVSGKAVKPAGRRASALRSVRKKRRSRKPSP